MYNSVVVHYGEIGIKGKNRSFFEKKLVENIRWTLNENFVSVKRILGRIIIEIDNKVNTSIVKEKLKNVFGISNFSFAVKSTLELEDIKKELLRIIPENTRTFRVRATRSNKSYKYTSSELDKILGEFVLENKNLKVNLESPDKTLYIEITDKESFIYLEKIKSLGGLPVGTSGKVISLISGGIDSPVSSFLTMKRGCSIIFAHFFNSAINTKQSLEKVIDIIKVLSKYQFKTKLYLIPFENIQKEIIKYVPSKFRMIVYRRYMLKISEKILENEKAEAFVDGVNLSQVASQTVSNIYVIDKATNYLVFHPLLGFDKEEIIQQAKNINTFQLSILPYQDCCSFLISEHPATRSNLNEILNFEKKLNEKYLIEESIKNSAIRIIKN